MKALTFTRRSLLTTIVALFWACGSLVRVQPVAASVPALSVSNAPYTSNAKPPHSGKCTPRYRVTLIHDTEPEPTAGTVTMYAAGHQPVSATPMRPLVRRPSTLYHEVPPKLRHFRFQPLTGYDSVQPLAINHHHQIVGYCSGGGSGAWLVILARAFVWQKGRMYALETLPGYAITHAVALNDRGIIAGDATIDSFPADMDIPGHALCWVRRQVRDLGTGEAMGLNNAGDIVGDSGTGPADYYHDPHALLWTHGYRYDLNGCIPSRSGWVLSSASGINGKGQIVGHGLFHGKDHAFLLTPTAH